MKKAVFFSLLVGAVITQARAQNPVNWTEDQLLQPSALAKTLNAGNPLPRIYAVGPGALIPHSISIGMTRDDENLAKLKKDLSAVPKNESIVVYCGCCPFEHCPNVRPAIAALKAMHFTNYKLLNLSHNLKTDWIDKGYPTTKL